MRCDFCDGGPVTATVIADSFEMPSICGVHQGSLGNWAACETCAALIRADRWTDLETRVSRSMDVGDAFVPYFAEMYTRLRAHMHGFVEGVTCG